MAFLLFLLVNVTLFLRPAEIIPALDALPIYNYTILAALVAALPKVVTHLTPHSLTREPVTLCVLGMLAAVVMSHVAQFDLWSARQNGFEFLKVVIYYLLLTAVVDSGPRLRNFLYVIALLAAASGTIAILNYYEIISIPSLTILEYSESIDPETGLPITFRRMQSTGIFGDPNDLSMIAVLGTIIALYGVSDRGLGPVRWLWVVPLGLLLATVALTKSRGGLLALGAAIAFLSYRRFGLWKSLIPMALFVPVAGVLLAGRGSAMDGGTGAHRAELWSEGLLMLKDSPLFGIGMNEFADRAGLVAHNSFVHCFAELGFFGGTAFLGAFWFAGRALWNLAQPGLLVLHGERGRQTARMQPFVLAALVGCATSLFSLSRAYTIPTYLVLGVANAYCLDTQRLGMPATVVVTGRRLVELIPVSLGLLAFIYLFIKLSVR